MEFDPEEITVAEVAREYPSTHNLIYLCAGPNTDVVMMDLHRIIRLYESALSAACTRGAGTWHFLPEIPEGENARIIHAVDNGNDVRVHVHEARRFEPWMLEGCIGWMYEDDFVKSIPTIPQEQTNVLYNLRRIWTCIRNSSRTRVRS